VNDFEDKLHHTWIQILIDSNHHELAAMLIDGELEITNTASELREYGHCFGKGLAVGIPYEYYSIIRSNEYYREVIESRLDKLFRDYNRISDNRVSIVIELRIKLLDEDWGWRDKVRELLLNAKDANQGVVVEKTFVRDGKQPLLYNEMKFGSRSEVRIAQELEARRVLFFPLPLAVRSDTGAVYLDHREPDFLICQDGTWGILEVAFHPDRYEKDSEKDIWFKKSGILCIQHYTAERCFNYPSEVVDEFLQLLAKHKK
jgi:hypothetical protein